MILSQEKNVSVSKQPGMVSMDMSTGSLIKNINEMIIEDFELDPDEQSLQVTASGFHFYLRARDDINQGKEILHKIMFLKSKFIGKSYDDLINHEI